MEPPGSSSEERRDRRRPAPGFDPDEALAELVAMARSAPLDPVTDLFLDLDAWLTAHGHLPQAWTVTQ